MEYRWQRKGLSLEETMASLIAVDNKFMITRRSTIDTNIFWLYRLRESTEMLLLFCKNSSGCH